MHLSELKSAYAGQSESACSTQKEHTIEYLKELKLNLAKIIQKISIKTADEHSVQLHMKKKDDFLAKKSALAAQSAIHEKTKLQLEAAEQIATDKGLWDNPTVQAQHRTAVIEQRLSSARLYKEDSILRNEEKSIKDEERRYRRQIELYEQKQCAASLEEHVVELDRYRSINPYGLISLLAKLTEASGKCGAIIDIQKLAELQTTLEECAASSVTEQKPKDESSQPDSVVIGVLILFGIGATGIIARAIVRRRLSPRV